jgi:hypothetical protein
MQYWARECSWGRGDGDRAVTGCSIVLGSAGGSRGMGKWQGRTAAATMDGLGSAAGGRRGREAGQPSAVVSFAEPRGRCAGLDLE